MQVKKKAVKIAQQPFVQESPPLPPSLATITADRRTTIRSQSSRGPSSKTPSSYAPSVAPSFMTTGTRLTSKSSASRASSAQAPPNNALPALKNAPVGCLMSYGVAAGPVNAGVLQVCPFARDALQEPPPAPSPGHPADAQPLSP